MQLCNIREFEVVIANNSRLSKNGFHLLVSLVRVVSLSQMQIPLLTSLKFQSMIVKSNGLVICGKKT